MTLCTKALGLVVAWSIAGYIRWCRIHIINSVSVLASALAALTSIVALLGAPPIATPGPPSRAGVPVVKPAPSTVNMKSVFEQMTRLGDYPSFRGTSASASPEC